MAFITDVSDQVRAQNLLAEREASFRNMADNSPVMIWVSGTDGTCTYFNNTWLEFTGRTLEEEMGNGWASGVHPDDLDFCLTKYKTAFDRREIFAMEYRLRRKDGQYRWIMDAGRPTFSENVFTGYNGSCSDVHDQKLMHEGLEALVESKTKELSAALTREKEMNELKSRFVSMASHEFRTPLSVVLSSLSLIEQYGATRADERIQKHLDKIRTSVTNLTSVLNDFLSLDKLEQGNVEIETRLFDLLDFVKSIIEEVKGFRKKGQEILLNHLGDTQVRLDQGKLRYILLNLLSNAIKYSPPDTTITASLSIDRGQVSIDVKDTGIGIPEEEQKFLFTKFFRANNTGNIQGTGLGLTIVKRYVELMGGDVSFVSSPEQGTTFSVSIHSA